MIRCVEARTGQLEGICQQKAITTNIVPSIKAGGRLVYLTCSVYKQENEEVVEYLVATHGLKLVEQQYFQASAEGGDVLFGAVLVKSASEPNAN